MLIKIKGLKYKSYYSSFYENGNFFRSECIIKNSVSYLRFYSHLKYKLMQRRRFVKSSLLTATALSTKAINFAADKNGIGTKALYELREYELHFGSNENDLHTYF